MGGQKSRLSPELPPETVSVLGVGEIPGEFLRDGISSFICDRSWPLARAASLNRTNPKLTEDMEERSVTGVRPDCPDISELPLEATAGDRKPGSVVDGLAVVDGLGSPGNATSRIRPGVGWGGVAMSG